VLYGISGRDCTLVISNLSTYASGIPVYEYTWLEMPLLRDIAVPLSFFTNPIKSVGADTYATIATTIVPARTLSATFLLQSTQLTNQVLFPFSLYSVKGLPPFLKQKLILVFRKPFENDIVTAEIPEAVPTRWELQVRDNNVATVTITWSFNTVNFYDRAMPVLISINPDDEFVTIRNVITSFNPDIIPPHGVRGLTFRVNVPVSWRHRINIHPTKIAYDFSINRWDVELQLTFSPDSPLWMMRQVELLPSTDAYEVSFSLIPQDGVSRVFYLTPPVRLETGNTSVRVEGPVETTVTLRAMGFSTEVFLI